MTLTINWHIEGHDDRIYEAWVDSYYIKIFCDFRNQYVIEFDDIDPAGAVYGPLTYEGYKTFELAIEDVTRKMPDILKARQDELTRIKGSM